ncbi:cellular retinoic acid-binding protein 2-like [Carassius auratus]|uniref:Cellular retinoic acid-binding protein 2-like n=1 Tax=Carassius auratus TaxID=7957 RepID=A0A6P6LV71_CARAU|nr:cellular retinoic acid-binding protein 2-like [Carassius auratus]XP_026087727.1 cellular retinoic acid-binding protein 2-like [Carassius auratus]XP_052389724.1 cellular retinoic acid-binding protein 2-like [Carassius gibelio]
MESNKKRTFPDFSGSWKITSSDNFEELLKAIGINAFLRKIAVAAASKPAVEITQQGERLSIQTSTSVRTTHVSFTVGKAFNETTVDGRLCTSYPEWETDRKITCEQILHCGEGPKTSWTRELTIDGKMILTMRVGDVVCTRVYERD